MITKPRNSQIATRFNPEWFVFAFLIVLFSPGALALNLAADIEWKDADGRILPFQTQEELEDFLKTAKVLEMKRTSVGTTAPRRVLLERGGIRLYACFRNVKIHKQQERLQSGAVKLDFRDDAIFEVAAYRLSRLLGYRNIPPTVLRKIRGEDGTLQIWVQDCMMEKDRVDKKLSPPSIWKWAMQLQAMQLFDMLVFNEDRNAGNMLIDSDWDIWMIDHTRAFRTYGEVVDLEKLKFVERGVWEHLSQLSSEEIEECLKPYLRGREISALLKRRAQLVEYVQGLIEDKGSSQVLFVLWPQAS